jgi:hypothetical protein
VGLHTVGYTLGEDSASLKWVIFGLFPAPIGPIWSTSSKPTVVPCPGSLSVFSSPPRWLALSRIARMPVLRIGCKHTRRDRRPSYAPNHLRHQGSVKPSEASSTSRRWGPESSTVAS